MFECIRRRKRSDVKIVWGGRDFFFPFVCQNWLGNVKTESPKKYIHAKSLQQLFSSRNFLINVSFNWESSEENQVKEVFLQPTRRRFRPKKEGKKRKARKKKKTFSWNRDCVTLFQQLLLWKKFLCFLRKTLALLDGKFLFLPLCHRRTLFRYLRDCFDQLVSQHFIIY